MKFVLAMTVAALSLGACATITKGTEDTVKLDSEPTGATVTVSDMANKLRPVECVTPCTLELNRKWPYNVVFSKDGFESVEAQLEPKLSSDGTAGMAGNILIGGIVGAAIDGSTGAMNDLKPNPLFVTLTPIGGLVSVENAVGDVVEAAKELDADNVEVQPGS